METRKKFIIAISSIGVIAIITAVYLIFFSQSNNDSVKVVNGIKLSEEDQEKAAAVAEDYFKMSSEWGLKISKLNPDNVYTALSSINDTENASAFWNDRRTVYSNLKTNYLAEGSPLDYSNNIIIKWTDEVAKEGDFSFSSPYVFGKTRAEGEPMKFEGFNTVLATVDMKSTNKLEGIQKTKDDVSWDGSYVLSSKSFNNTATVNVVKLSSGEWKVYNMSNVKYPFLTVLQKDPDSFDYSQYLEGFNTYKTITSTDPQFKNKKNNK